MTSAPAGRRAPVAAPDVDLDRLRSFSDSVFAVAITVLAATFRLPVVDPSGPGLGSDLAAEWPRYLSYLAGFVVIGWFWLSHHRLFDLLVRAGVDIALLNLGFLFLVVLVPFSTIVLGEYRTFAPAHVLFDANVALVGAANVVLWARATRHRRDVDPALDGRALRIYRWRTATVPVVFTLALVVGAVSEQAAVGTWLLVLVGSPLIRLVLGPVPADEAAREADEHDVDRDDPPGRRARRRRQALARLTGFSDNVYAFAVTVLILPLATKLPDTPFTTADQLEDFLRGAALKALSSYALGFAVIGLFWMLHSRVFASIRGQDRPLLVLNLIHLMAIATLPFATSILIAYDGSSTASIVYAGLAGFSGAALAAVIVHATAHHRLVDPTLSAAAIRARRRSAVVVPASFGLSMVVAIWYPDLAQLFWYAGFVAVRVQQHRWARAHPDERRW